MATLRNWILDTNSRGRNYMYYERAHLGLSELKRDLREDRYLGKDSIPRYPKYVFNESNVCHVTEMEGLKGIVNDNGFRGGDDGFLWWSLSMSANSMQQQPFVKEFATSPAFQPESRYGNFRFTFQLTELLNQYSKQFCWRTSPVLRVFQTQFYNQEIVYCVLVHPRHIRRYRRYPRLPLNIGPVRHLCGYSQKTITWCCQSPSDKYKYSLKNGVEYPSELNQSEYFVWDKVAVAFHMKENWVLRLGRRRLSDHLSVCEVAKVNLLKEPKMSLKEAKMKVKYLKRCSISNLKI